MKPVIIRSLTAEDVPAIAALEAEAYEPALHESPEAFARLIEVFGAGAIGAFDEHGLCGYALGVPLRSGSVLELRQPLRAIPADADMFYVHDVAIAARCRGQGLGRTLAERLMAVGAGLGFERFELVSVQGSAPFWARFGFVATRELEYVPGGGAIVMVRRRSS
jgi:ribosomal protein S18 acetylase RimI-like enzyme